MTDSSPLGDREPRTKSPPELPEELRAELPEDNYYASIEAYFVQRRGAPLFISPAEWQLVWNWERAGIPLRVVKEGIDRVFDRPRTPQKRRKLGYCRQTVEALFRRFRESRLGDDEAEDDRCGAERHLNELVGRLRQLAASSKSALASSEATRAAASLERHLGRLSELAKGDFSRALPEIENELGRTEDRLLDSFERTLGETESGALFRDSEASLRSYRDRMPQKVYDAAVKSAYRRRLRARMGLTPLSLFDR